MMTEREKLMNRTCAKFIKTAIEETRRGEVNGAAAMADIRLTFVGIERMPEKRFEEIKRRVIARNPPTAK